MYDSTKYLICLVCFKTDDCTDNPLVVIVGKNQSTEKVFQVNSNKSNEIKEEINKYDGYKYNGIPKYFITISEKEYDQRFKRLMR